MWKVVIDEFEYVVKAYTDNQAQLEALRLHLEVHKRPYSYESKVEVIKE